MKPTTIEQLARAIGAAIPADAGNLITGVSTDTRTIKPGDCFFAIAGDNFDGRDYIPAAIEKGAACVVANRRADTENLDSGHLIVPDTIRALGEFARWYRNQLPATVVAITGSAGKTTTRHIAHHVLARHFKCHQAQKSFNNHIGLPLTILAAEPHHEIIIAELGTNNPGEIEYLSRIAQPDIALVNNVGAAHLEGFGTIENIAREKTSIRAGLKPAGKLLVNADSKPLLNYCTAENIPATTFGSAPAADIRATDLVTTGPAGSLTIDNVTIAVLLPGIANLQNTLAAWAIAKQFDLTPAQFAAALPGLESPEMRLNLNYLGPITILNDCYNANPASMTNAIQTLAHLAAAKNTRSVFICGYMGELGPHADSLHAELGQTIAAADLDLLLTVGPHAETTAEAAIKSSATGLKTHIFPDVASLCNNLQHFLQPDDIILVKGSRSAKLEAAVNALTSLFG